MPSRSALPTSALATGPNERESPMIRTVLAFSAWFAFPLAVGAEPSHPAETQAEFIWGANGHPFAQEGYRPDTDGVPYEDQIALLAESGMSYYRCDLGLGD